MSCEYYHINPETHIVECKASEEIRKPLNFPAFCGFTLDESDCPLYKPTLATIQAMSPSGMPRIVRAGPFITEETEALFDTDNSISSS